MKKNEFSALLRNFARELSPTKEEQNIISDIYQSFCVLLGDNNCLQIGSYPRFTAVTPVHDLDILYILGKWSEFEHDPSDALQELLKLINKDYINPTTYTIEVALQTHSVTVTYLQHSKEVLSVDIVPAYTYGHNEFQLDKYKVPEILKKKHGKKRQEFYQKLYSEHKQMDWISSDPRGYIKVASNIDQKSKGDFRKTAKTIKYWKAKLEEADKNLKLKSFHLEQVVTGYFLHEPNTDIYDAIFKFFCELPTIISKPNQIPDRANNGKYIDDYIADLTQTQKDKIEQARDGFLIKLEEHTEEDPIEDLFEINFHDRSCISEQYLFDERIPVLTTETVCINGWIQKDRKDFRRLSAVGYIDNGHYIRFESFMGPLCDMYKWKVKNDNKSHERRGEITDHQTRNHTEKTVYVGSHYVECYAIANNVCIAKARQQVIISR